MPIWKQIEGLGKFYYCPVRCNRQVSPGPSEPYERADALAWSDAEEAQGRLVHLKKMPKGHRVKLFRLALSTERTDYVVMGDVAQSSAQALRDEWGLRWKT